MMHFWEFWIAREIFRQRWSLARCRFDSVYEIYFWASSTSYYPIGGCNFYPFGKRTEYTDWIFPSPKPLPFVRSALRFTPFWSCFCSFLSTLGLKRSFLPPKRKKGVHLFFWVNKGGCSFSFRSWNHTNLILIPINEKKTNFILHLSRKPRKDSIQLSSEQEKNATSKTSH